MNIQRQMKKDLSAAIKAKEEKKKDALRVILGEFGRLDKKEISDDEIVKILKKLMKSEKEVLEQKGEAADSEFIKVIENYLPKMATEEEIAAWIHQNIDFSQFENKMQAMSLIMKHFGATADGNFVKTIIQRM
ncbi:MAG: GatB/YqeY domain-containing protein [Desulfobacteraceae bacterium]|nr:GatB/YqeY domain-containing protein [Desulfobacteraceae bacterium]